MKSKVAVLKTSPQTVLEDYKKLMHLADYQKYLPKDKDTALKINISWHHFYPACSTTPWQLEGVIKTLLGDGYKAELIHGCHNRTVVVNSHRGEENNKHKPVIEKYGLRNVHLYEGEEWVRYEPKGKMLVLPEVFPQGIQIPRRMIGENIIHLPTMKTHVFTTMTGAMKNAFGGLLHEKRHWTHSVIHETLVDLLTIQKEIHSGIFAVMDGTFVGDGPGPRCMEPSVKGYILASADQVAIDAVSAKMMGFDPLSLKFIRLAHEMGLGCGDVREMEIVGEDISEINWRFKGQQNTFASKGQKMIYWGPLKPLEKVLLRTVLAPWSYVASILYHDYYWYPFVGRPRVNAMLNTEWGKLFKQY
ncbi:MAG: DUF362 domain-containing protein [Candidatus Schekmanbacteria bacterium]|nr:DUF362 domain-containing protein [Candidatus Schekmanbacteria bacterium]